MKSILMVFLGFFISYLWGQNPHLRHFGVDEGLPSSFIYTVIQDTKGYIWINTDKGIVHFDAYHFETFGTKDSLPYNDFWAAKEDSKGRIWFSGYGTHFVYYDYKDRKFHIKENKTALSRKSQPAEASVEDANGDIWYNCHGKVINVNKDIFYANAMYKKTLNHDFAKIFIYAPTTTSGIPINKAQSSIQLVGKKNITDTQSLFNQSFIGDNIEWLNQTRYVYYNAQNQSLYYSNIYKLSPFFTQKMPLKMLTTLPLKANQAIEIYAINESEIFINTHSECFVVDTNLHRLPQYDFLHKWDINSIYADREGNRWICTKSDGLYLLTAEAAKTHTFPVLQKQDIRAICTDATKRMWIGTSEGKVFYTENEIWKNLPLNDDNPENIRDMIVTDANTLIIAFETHNLHYPLSLLPHSNPKIQMEKATFTHEFDCNKDTCHSISFYKDRNKVMFNDYLSFRNFSPKKDGGILYPTPMLGRYSILSDRGNQQLYTNFNIKKRVTACLEAKFQPENTWVGTTVGLFFYEKNKLSLDSLKNIKQKYPILSKAILDMASDSSGNIWVATDGYGLYWVQSNQEANKQTVDFQAFEVENLGGKIVKSVFIDKRNHIWAATNQGAFEIEVITKGTEVATKVKKYTIAQGLATNEINCVYANEEFAFIGTTKGLTKIPLTSSTKTRWQSPLDLQVKVNGKNMVSNSTLALGYQENNIRFDFVCLSFKSDKNILYSFRIGKNEEESAWQNTLETYQSFPLLAPGNYVFEVKAQDIDGYETEVKRLIFTISPPWWKHIAFQMACLLGFIGGIWGIYRWQIGEIKRISALKLTASEAQTQLQVERTESVEKAAKYQKQIADLEAKTLLSQMNPHFIFNVLTSIQSYVLNNEPYISHDYLTRFAKLIRTFLDASREKYIPIEKEYEMLKNYISLEQLRFKHFFDFSIEVAANVDTNIEIPPMMIQPFVENAINHGLKYKETKGFLTVYFEEENAHTILCVIEDDGVGREKAKALQEGTLRGHKSLALKIIQERIAILAEVENWYIRLSFIDKKDEQGKAIGTRVELRFPFR